MASFYRLITVVGLFSTVAACGGGESALTVPTEVTLSEPLPTEVTPSEIEEPVSNQDLPDNNLPMQAPTGRIVGFGDAGESREICTNCFVSGGFEHALGPAWVSVENFRTNQQLVIYHDGDIIHRYPTEIPFGTPISSVNETAVLAGFLSPDRIGIGIVATINSTSWRMVNEIFESADLSADGSVVVGLLENLPTESVISVNGNAQPLSTEVLFQEANTTFSLAGQIPGCVSADGTLIGVSSKTSLGAPDNVVHLLERETDSATFEVVAQINKTVISIFDLDCGRDQNGDPYMVVFQSSDRSEASYFHPSVGVVDLSVLSPSTFRDIIGREILDAVAIGLVLNNTADNRSAEFRTWDGSAVIEMPFSVRAAAYDSTRDQICMAYRPSLDSFNEVCYPVIRESSEE